MLNPNWTRVYDPKDIDDFNRLTASAPPIVYPFQSQILYRLLGRYYRTNKGNQLHPDNPRYLAAYFEMLERTMEELKKQVALKEDFEKRQHAEEWKQNQERDEDPIDRILREDELRRDASLKNISHRKASNVPNPLRTNYDYSAEMGGPEWQNRVKNFEKDQESAGGETSCGIQNQKK